MSTEPIAIVGISCRLPGGSNDVDSYWNLLADGGKAWAPVPADRFNETAFHHPNANDPNGTNNHRGGHFIDGDVRDFDHAFFHLSPQQAAAMDPQQRILLELAYEALESAGWIRESYEKSRTAVYAAIFGTDYERNLCKDVLDLPIYQSVGTGAAILANRISYALDLRGPSVTLDTGCSGGMVALHHAVQSLRSGESNAALVAAANLQLMPDHYIGMANQHMVGSTGRCYPFDVRGDGYGRGEGFVVVALKRLSEALHDRDPIRSVILNTGVNQDGFTASGITHPNHTAQADLIRETYARVKLSPLDVAYIEAHGTGTVAGDKEELLAIDEVFTGAERSLPLYVGSNKGSIGHTESTSGLASLVKACLMLDHKSIPPVAGFASPKPGLALQRIKIPTARIPWPNTDQMIPRISINSFGYGGTNAHAIVERGPRTCQEVSSFGIDDGPHLFILSANNQTSLRDMVKSLSDWLTKKSHIMIKNVCYTLCHRRSALPWRFSCVATSPTSLKTSLNQFIGTMPARVAPVKKEVIFIFTGQGAQWLGMGRELLLSTSSVIFRDSIRISQDILSQLGASWDLETELLRQDDSQRINNAELAQPITTAVQIALVALLHAQGVHPAAVVGHSSGEIAAAFAAGHLSQRTALAVAFHRGFMAACSKGKGLPRGAMLSVGIGEHETTSLLQGLEKGRAAVACVNSPSSVTISGDMDAIDEVAERIKDQGHGTFHKRLLVDTAYHSHHMQAVAVDYKDRLQSLDFGTASTVEAEDRKVTMVSSVTGQVCSEFDASYWVANLVSTVRFSDAVQEIARMHQQRNAGQAIFIEVGPHCALVGPMRQCLMADNFPKFEHDYFSVLKRGTDAVTSVLELMGRLFERGLQLKFENVSALSPEFNTAVVVPDLPSYKWDHSIKHWHESRLSRQYRTRREPYHHLLGVRVINSTTLEPRWRHMVGLGTLPWLADHIIDGLMIFPGAGYVCMAAEAISQLVREEHPEQVLETIAFHDVSFLRGLIVPDAPQRVEMHLSLRRQPNISSLSFAYSVTAYWDGKWHEHSTGLVQGITKEQQKPQTDLSVPAFQHPQINRGEIVNIEELYIDMAAHGNKYGPSFMGLRSLTMDLDGTRSTAIVQVPDIASVMPSHHQARHILHPATFDSMFHIGIPMIRQKHGPGSVMPVHIKELLISAETDALSSSGSNVEVQAHLTSSHFRTSEIDMTVTAHGRSILSAFSIESRSFTIHARESDGDFDPKGICYELDWKPDMEFLREIDMLEDRTLGGLAGHICFKTARLAVLELGAGRGDMALSFLSAISANSGTLSTYDFADTTPQYFEDARKRLVGYPVQYFVLDPRRSLEGQAFPSTTYDVVLVSDVDFIVHAVALVQKKGLLVLSVEPQDDSWHRALRTDDNDLQIQLTFMDDVANRLIVVGKKADTRASTLPLHVQIFTHSRRDETPPWVISLETTLSARGASVSRETIHQGLIETRVDVPICTLVIDDVAHPILSDPHTFDAAISLLQQEKHILWLSPMSPPPMHQITGVARTAHAENDSLRLTTIHAAGAVLETSGIRLIEVLEHCMTRLSNGDGMIHGEREYRIREDVGILVPRLHSSSRLNRAISKANQRHIECVDIETFRYKEAQKRIMLAREALEDSSNHDFTFISDAMKPLADDAVEIETQTFVLSKSDIDNNLEPLGEYAGVIKRVGKAVQGFATGDAVVALSTDGTIGANRLRLPSSNAVLRSKTMLPDLAAAIILPMLAAVYALQHLAHVKCASNLLIHGVLSADGRATLAVARSIGMETIIVTASSIEEARVVAQQLDIPARDILISRPSLSYPYHRRNLTLDVVVLADDSASSVPEQIWTSLKPSRDIIVIPSTSPSYDINMANLPGNTKIHLCHIADILRSDPEYITTLLQQASKAWHHFPSHGFAVESHDVARVAEALRLIQYGMSRRVIMRVEQNSLVRAAIKLWDDEKRPSENATYVVAGGMGDLGRRLLMLMASRGASSFVTLSRRSIQPQDYQKFMAVLGSIRPGCQVHCLICDVTDDKSVADAAARIATLNLPPVRGVIQSAVVLQDRTLERMNFGDFRSVTWAKIEGTLNLERTFTTPHLDFFLMLSSTVVVTGASGQANYNAGNAVQDALAHDRQPGFMSLNVGWIEDAIHTSNDKTRLQGLWRTGLRPILPDQLSRYFDYLLLAASLRTKLRQAIIGFDAESLSHTSAGNSNVQSALFCHVRSALDASEGDLAAEKDAQTFQHVVESGDDEDIMNFINTAIVRQLTTLISVDATQVNERDGSILDLGLDSLVAIELRNWITREFNAPLQSSEIMTDQPIRSLAQKVASRSKVILSHTRGIFRVEDDLSTRGTDMQPHLQVDTPLKLPSSSVDALECQLAPIPLPSLESTLQLFEDSRRGVDSAEDQYATRQAVVALLEGPGAALHQQVQEAGPSVVAEDYDRQVYLERREPLAEQGTFTFIHPLDVPTQTQARRAAILTIAAVDFSRRLDKGVVAPDTLHGQISNNEGREWLFHAVRRPSIGVDWMERCSPSNSVAVLRRGHIFQLELPQGDAALSITEIEAAYEEMIQASHDEQPSVCTLTADERDSWAKMRKDLEKEPSNTAALSCIDKAAFVLCLDDASPASSRERYTQFLLGGEEHPFANRWLDKPFQLTVTSNGLSAETYEHTKLDGLDARALHNHVVQALRGQSLNSEQHSNSTPCSFKHHIFKTTQSIVQRIDHVQTKSRSYGPLDHRLLEIGAMSLASLRGTRSQPNATAHLAALLALYLVDGEIRPAWEKISLGAFAHGRVEWVQTVSTAAREFILAAAAAAKGENSMERAHAALSSATYQHSRILANASQGHGMLGPLYALRGAVQRQAPNAEQPQFFQTRAWNATRRGGPRQDVKLGFMRFMPDDERGVHGDSSWDEAGFLVPGERGVYIHCNVQETFARYAISGRPSYVDKVYEALESAAKLTLNILREGH